MANTNILIVDAPYYEHISAELVAGATAHLDANDAAWERITVPGALEIPTAIALAAEAGEHDGFIALGCVIRGETSHYDIVAGESARALMQLGIERHVPIGNGILTVDTEAQALARARVSEKNKGGDAAAACLVLIALKRRFGTGAAR